MALVSVGFDYKISENTSLYVKAIGKYYHVGTTMIDSSLTYPIANSFSAMVEVGLTGNMNH